MAISVISGLMKYKDEDGNSCLLLPITTVDNVDGMDEIEASIAETVKFTEQTLTDEQKAQARENLGITANGDSVISWDDITNKPFGEVETVIELLPLTLYEGFALDTGFNLYCKPVEITYTLTVGETYTVFWDDSEHKCVAQDLSDKMPGCIALGNLLDYGYSGNNEDFVILYVEGVDVMYYSLTDTEPHGSHRVRILKDGVVTKKLDPKYLPDNMGGGSSLPEVTTSDTGKFLRVSVDGVWAVEAIPNAEEARF